MFVFSIILVLYQCTKTVLFFLNGCHQIFLSILMCMTSYIYSKITVKFYSALSEAFCGYESSPPFNFSR